MWISEACGWIARMTETSSLSLRLTICGASWIRTALEKAIGWPTNSGRCSMSILRPKNPRLMTAQLTTAAATGANNGEEERSEFGDREIIGFGFSFITIQTFRSWRLCPYMRGRQFVAG